MTHTSMVPRTRTPVHAVPRPQAPTGRRDRVPAPLSSRPRAWHDRRVSTPDWGIEEPEAHFDTHPDLPHHPASDPAIDPAIDPAAHRRALLAAARAHGFEPAPAAAVWCFLPAVWPRAHRAWLGADDGPEQESLTGTRLADLGLPPAPAGRAWLLRSPEPDRSVSDVLDDVWQDWLDGGGEPVASPEFVAHVERLMQTE